jgi:hypothetical protein
MSESYDRQQSKPHPPDLRAADTDREAVADLLREHHVAGRLGSEEFQERLDRCYAAKTYGELDELVADLPREEPASRVQRPWRWPALALVPLLIAAIVVTHGHLLWLAIPFFFVYRPFLWRSAGRRPGWGCMGPSGHQNPPPGTYV